MGGYLPSSDGERREMLAAVGLSSMEELFSQIPPSVERRPPGLPAGMSEMETAEAMRALAAQNRVYTSVFRGAGAYRHYIPAVVRSAVSKEEFLTAYTPYQAELSQGILQAIFEYQTMICELTGMDVSNASVYDGASAAAEAVSMCRGKTRARALVSGCVHPMTLAAVRTYCEASGMRVEVIPELDGATDQSALEAMLGADAACVLIQQPNFYGRIEEADKIGASAHAAGANYIMAVNPIAAALLKSAGECGADIAVGEGQPLGMPLSFGGPYLGFMACSWAMMRRLPGRIVGETADREGRRAFVLTLQAREQHIRREKASSNICTNQAHCALTAAVYLSAMGTDGLQKAAALCTNKAHYLAARLAEAGCARVHRGDFFHEFLTFCPVDPEYLMLSLERRGILGGLPLADRTILWCATEMNTKQQIDALASAVGEVCRYGSHL